MSKRYFIPLLLVIIAAFFIRVTNLSFPAFTSDEARIAFRGYTLATSGRDELGRFLPLLFNSLTDYQLPAVSYIAALGEIIFGKTDFGVRIPFIMSGVGLIILTYKISKLVSQRKSFWVVSALVLIFSPALIFLSKFPNDSIVLAFFMTLLFYLLIKDKPNIILIIFVLILLLTVSKFAWFIITPFVMFTLHFYQNNLSKGAKIKLSIFSLFLAIVAVGFYLQVPQSSRSFLENNLSTFSDMTIKNGINKLRGQGLESGWPNYLEVILFNKTHFLVVGFLKWLSNLQLGIYFGQFDKTGHLGFSQMGALNKILIIPFIGGLVYLIRKGRKKERLLLAYFIILTFPAIFNIPNSSQILIVLTIPFAALVIAFGFMQFNRTISLLIILAMVLEVGLNLLYLAPEEKNTNLLRPNWVRGITQDVYSQSINNKTAVSDDVVNDIVTFIEWYNPVDARAGYLDVPNPYKFRQSNIKNIKIIGSDNKLYSCRENDYDKVFVSRRDMDRIKDYDTGVVKTYQDGLNQEVAYLLEKGLCIR